MPAQAPTLMTSTVARPSPRPQSVPHLAACGVTKSYRLGRVPVPVLHGDAQQLPDDRDGHRQRQVADQVHLAVAHRVQQAVHDLDDARPQPVDEPGREDPRDQPPQPPVVRPVRESDGGV